MRRLLLLATVIVPVSAAAQSLDEKINECSKIDLGIGRLLCYDQAAGRPLISAEPAAEPEDATAEDGSTAWDITDDTNSLDRSRRIILAKYSVEKDQYGREPKGALALRCIEGRTSVVALTTEYVSSISSPTVDYRIGDGKPVNARWSSDGRVLFGPEGGAAISLVKELAAADEMFFRISPARGSIIQFRIKLDGLSEHMTLLADACKWPAPKPKS